METNSWETIGQDLLSASNKHLRDSRSGQDFPLPPTIKHLRDSRPGPSVCLRVSAIHNLKTVASLNSLLNRFWHFSFFPINKPLVHQHIIPMDSSADRSVETCIPRTPVWSSFDCTHCHFRGRHTKCFVPLGPSHFIVRKFAYLSSRASQRWHLQSASWGACLLVNSGLRKVTQVEW